MLKGSDPSASTRSLKGNGLMRCDGCGAEGAVTNTLHITVAVVFWSDGRLRHQPKLALSRYQSTTRAVCAGWVVLGRPSIFRLLKKVVIRQEVQYEVAA
jgi:hypothetical protein